MRANSGEISHRDTKKGAHTNNAHPLSFSYSSTFISPLTGCSALLGTSFETASNAFACSAIVSLATLTVSNRRGMTRLGPIQWEEVKRGGGRERER